jgi:hypothetical protein
VRLAREADEAPKAAAMPADETTQG